MFVGIEAFIDSELDYRRSCPSSLQLFINADDEEGKYDHEELLRRFGEYIDGLGTQPVTVTISSILEDMLDSYAHVTNGLQEFSWKQDLAAVVEDFIYTRECWFYPKNRAPVLEATFSVLDYGPKELDIDIHFTWNPPIVGFEDLKNVITEGNEFVLKACYITPPFRSVLPVTGEYFVGPGAGWLRWDAETESFRGTVPPKIASQIGAERFEAYTMPLELTARITKQFPADMRFERIFRCALPLTVKRRPNRCAGDAEMVASPTVARPTASRLASQDSAISFGQSTSASPPRFATGVSRLGALDRPPLTRSPNKRLNSRPCPPPPTPKPRVFSVEAKENTRLSMEELNKLMERKAERPRQQSPLQMNSLSMARLHDAIAFSHAHSSLSDVEVRTLHTIRYGETSSSPSTQREWNADFLLNSTPEKGTPRSRRVLTPVGNAINLGRTHVNRHGKLASQSDHRSKDNSPVADTPPTRNISPPGFNALPVSAGRSPGFHWKGRSKAETLTRSGKRKPLVSNRSLDCGNTDNDGSPAGSKLSGPKMACYTCTIRGRNPVSKKCDGICQGCEEAALQQKAYRDFQHRTCRDFRSLFDELIHSEEEESSSKRDDAPKKIDSVFDLASDNLPDWESSLWSEKHPPQQSQGDEFVLPASEPEPEPEPKVQPRAYGEIGMKEEEIEDWQRSIQQNFKEFEHRQAEKLDVTMDDVADSEESSSSGSEGLGQELSFAVE